MTTTTVFDLKGGLSGALAPTGDAEILVTTFVHDMTVGLRIGLPDTWWQKYAWTPPRTAQKTIIFYSIAGTNMEPFDGTVQREGNGFKSKSYDVTTVARGAIANTRKLRAGDLSGWWSNEPGALASASNKKLGIDLGALFAAAYASNASVLDSWGQKWLSSAADRRNNPFKPEYGSHLNLTYSQAFTQSNIMSACNRLRQRRGTDGRFLGLEPEILLVSNQLAQEANLITGKRILVPVTGAGGDDTGGNTADAYQYLIPEVSLELPDYAWGIIANIGKLGLTEKEMPFVTILGIGSPIGNSFYAGPAGNATVPSASNTDLDVTNIMRPNSGIPPFEIRWWGPNSALFETTECIAVDLYNTSKIHAQDGRWFEMCSTAAAPP